MKPSGHFLLNLMNIATIKNLVFSGKDNYGDDLFPSIIAFTVEFSCNWHLSGYCSGRDELA